MSAERLNTGTVFSRIFSIYRRQAAVLLPAAAALYVIPAALNVPKGITAQALALATSFIATVCLQGIVAQAVRDISDDVRDLPLTGLLRSLPPVLAPLMWTAILILLGAFVGSLAFVIPGLIL
ncbi:MAG: hypothetical protein QOH13_2365, partial [Thermoleophilaceae bacterium]|nr:hypothetical protein [Thermoleophilaceae bacterium]